SSIPSVESNSMRVCAQAVRKIVDMVWKDIKLGDILTKESFENGITVTMALGGSTNAIIHLIAMAKRLNIDITMDDFDRISKRVPVLANIRPSGDKYLMQDFYYAGGLIALLKRLENHLNLDSLTVTEKSIREVISGAEIFIDDVIRAIDNPVYKEGSLAVLKGNLSPDGSVMKVSACNPKFLNHSGRAIVFDNYHSLKEFAEDEDADVTENDVIVLRNAGPKGGPGMPEWGMLPIPKKLLK